MQNSKKWKNNQSSRWKIKISTAFDSLEFFLYNLKRVAKAHLLGCCQSKSFNLNSTFEVFFCSFC